MLCTTVVVAQLRWREKWMFCTMAQHSERSIEDAPKAVTLNDVVVCALCEFLFLFSYWVNRGFCDAENKKKE